MKKRILIVEDDRALATVLCDNLASEGYDVEHISDGDQVLDSVRKCVPALVVLDVMLPGLDGFALCRLLAQHGKIPVLMLTARNRNGDKVKALDLGADDYITKPFDLREFLARVRAVLRRALLDADTVMMGSLTINFVQRSARRGDAELHLTDREFALLQYLSERSGHVVHRDELLRRFWGPEAPFTRSVDIAIARLRKKIEPNVHHPRFIHTVHGDGYTLTIEDRGSPPRP
jgi:DNA-binding response OmpR family regulator